MMDSMEAETVNVIIAVLSGKGGTGKTLVSVNLASIAETSAYIDSDVQELNGHLVFQAGRSAGGRSVSSDSGAEWSAMRRLSSVY